MKTRRSGILLHITSLPSDFGIGDLGKGAYVFADFLARSGQTIWQALPFSPSSPACGNSPYCSFSAFAGNPLLIGPDLLVQDGYVSWNDLSRAPSFDSGRTDYERAAAFKYDILSLAYERFKEIPDLECRHDNFAREQAWWLDDYALFVCLKEQFGGVSWSEWPRELRDRDEAALKHWSGILADRIKREKFYQFLFFRQWSALKIYCNRKQIQIIGDIPIYVSYDSADVWSNPHLFKLDDEKKPISVSGVPPDYFSKTGQLWGNPVYSWNRLRESSFAWWISRMEHNTKCFDMVRLDHFRGFIAFWEVPASEETAINGRWVKAPADEFFRTLLMRFPSLPIIAEDLGIITPDVREVMRTYGFPGMKILLFAFGDASSANPYIPHNHVEKCVLYTGTHDNNTARGWFEVDATEAERENLEGYFGKRFDKDTISWELIRVAMMSVAATAVIPMQDFLGLGAEARMNTPSVAFGNWEWRVRSEQLTPELSKKILEMTQRYGRI